MKIAIVTGESKGLGQSIATLFLQGGIHVIGLSRTGSKMLTEVAEENEVTYEHHSCDLSKAENTEKLIQTICDQVFQQDVSGIYLVNNAGVLKPMDQAMNTSAADIAYHFHVNTVAPMIIMNTLLKRSTEADVPVIGATVTSGAAMRPVYGWSAYCSSKASINMYTQTVALEQEERKTGHQVIAFSPGIMDTSMQAQIRSMSEAEFIQVDQFREYKKHGLLMDTQAVAQVLVNIMTDKEKINNGEIYKASDYLS